MRFRRFDGRTLLTAVCLGLSLGLSGYAAARSLPSSVTPVASSPDEIPVVAARTAMDAQTLLTADNVRMVSTRQVAEGTLTDLRVNDRYVLLVSVSAGQIINTSMIEGTP